MPLSSSREYPSRRELNPVMPVNMRERLQVNFYLQTLRTRASQTRLIMLSVLVLKVDETNAIRDDTLHHKHPLYVSWRIEATSHLVL